MQEFYNKQYNYQTVIVNAAQMDKLAYEIDKVTKQYAANGFRVISVISESVQNYMPAKISGKLDRVTVNKDYQINAELIPNKPIQLSAIIVFEKESLDSKVKELENIQRQNRAEENLISTIQNVGEEFDDFTEKPENKFDKYFEIYKKEYPEAHAELIAIISCYQDDGVDLNTLTEFYSGRYKLPEVFQMVQRLIETGVVSADNSVYRIQEGRFRKLL